MKSQIQKRQRMKAKPVILVVDDQLQNIELLEAHLVPQGYEIVQAANGEEALGKLSGNQIDLILLDVIMPGMDGFEVTRRVRQDHTHRLLPIILVTSLRETEDRVKGIEAGCDDFISKPFDKIELLARVRSLLKVKVYNDLMSNYEKELESEVTRRTEELKRALENLQQEITERKQAEAALQASSDEVKAMSQQLWQAAKLATMGELASSIAHELNNPLATVSLRVESLIAQTTGDDPRRRELEIIGHEVERMGNLVTNLLQFSRRSQKQISTVDIREEIEKTIELIHYHLRKNNIQVIREFAPEVPGILADRQQLRQLFLNLFTNASDAMPKGGTLTIRVAAQTEEKKIFIEIADTGTGIPPEILPKVMESFYTTKPEGKGTGLGLAICRRIAQEHWGTFDITSEGIPGKGTKVRITLSSTDPGNSIGLMDT